MPKRAITIFVVIDVLLVAAAIIAAFGHVKILYVIIGFAVFSAINGIILILSLVKSPAD